MLPGFPAQRGAGAHERPVLTLFLNQRSTPESAGIR